MSAKLSVSVPEIQWGFDGEHPTVRLDGWTTKRVDPFPGYGHDPAYVLKIARQVARDFPLSFPVHFYVPAYEDIGRTNGWCEIQRDWQSKDRPRPITAANIFLSGKRIPPHPAMARYLVAHEYGHAVDYFLADRLGYDADKHEFRDWYRKLRGIKEAGPSHYGGRTWHASTGEVLANDFRILVCGIETEFWPHPGTVRPEKVASIRKFWREAIGQAARAGRKHNCGRKPKGGGPQ
jgi:hypothetical protein